MNKIIDTAKNTSYHFSEVFRHLALTIYGIAHITYLIFIRPVWAFCENPIRYEGRSWGVGTIFCALATLAILLTPLDGVPPEMRGMFRGVLSTFFMVMTVMVAALWRTTSPPPMKR